MMQMLLLVWNSSLHGTDALLNANASFNIVLQMLLRCKCKYQIYDVNALKNVNANVNFTMQMLKDANTNLNVGCKRF